MGSCFFIGHRETPDRVYPTLLETIERHITEYGVTEFVVGQYGNFDRLVIRALSQAKRAHPDITLMLMTPILPGQQKGGSAGGIRRPVLSAGSGSGPQTACHHPSKPIHGGAQRFSHRLCAASRQQCQRTAGVCWDWKEKGKNPHHKFGGGANPSSKENR